MADCPHDTFEAQVTIAPATFAGPTPGGVPYYRVVVQARCGGCQALLTFEGLPVVSETIYRQVAVSPSATTVYLAAQLAVPVEEPAGTWVDATGPAPLAQAEEAPDAP